MPDVNKENRDVFPHTYSKICKRCLVNKSLDLYYNSTANPDGKQAYCKVCSKEFDKENRTIKKLSKSRLNNIDYFSNLNRENGGGAVGRPRSGYEDLTPLRIEFLNLQKEYWRKVFDERHNDVMNLIRDYDLDPANSLKLITAFHKHVRPKWKLQHKTNLQIKNEYYKFIREKTTPATSGSDSGTEIN